VHYILNKVVWGLLNPISLTLIVALVAWILSRHRRRLGVVLLVLDMTALWFFSTGLGACALGLPLERPYIGMQAAESAEASGAIVVLGGGIGKCEELVYPDMADAADRIWHAARLYHAQKAPLVVVSGTNDLVSTVPLLLDLGVPKQAIVVDNESRNTYENSRFTARLLKGGEEGTAHAGAQALLVTSAWHMTRACGNFEKSGLMVVPAPCDFKAHNIRYGCDAWWKWIVPSAESLMESAVFAKEWVGRLARR